MSIQLRGLHQQVRPYAEYALAVAAYYRLEVTITSTFRSWQEQQLLWSRYKRGLSRFPANEPGDSAHGYGLAFDSVVSPENQPMWDAIRRWVGFGVPMNDIVHAEVPGWRGMVNQR